MPAAPKKVVIAPDSFKESLPAAAVAQAIGEGLRQAWPHADLLCIPMADGGEGTVAAVIAATGGRTVQIHATDPLGQPITAGFGLITERATGKTTAILEVASASGLELVPLPDRNPLRTTSFGTGEVLRAAARSGAHRCVLGIGGSATVDGGAGLLQALGARLLDVHGRDIPRGGAGLAHLRHIDVSTLDPALGKCELLVASDVDNPLTGPYGAATIFGPQKGATPAMVLQLDDALANFARVLAQDLGIHIAQTPGAGAAGGIGAALIACLGATLRPGVELIAELVALEDRLRDADLVITGEGRIDAQTARGKAPIGVARLARRYKIPVIALAGSIGPDASSLTPHGIDAIFSIVPGPCTREEAFTAAAENLRRTAHSIAALWNLAAPALTD